MKAVISLPMTVLVLVAFFGLVVYFGSPLIGQASFVTGGLTISSIDDVNVIVNNQENPDGYFRVTAIADRGAESLSGYVSSGNINSETGVQTKRGFNIGLSGLKEVARYQVDNVDVTPLWEFEVAPVGSTNCDWTCTFSGMCVKKKQVGTIAGLSSTQTYSEVRVTVRNDAGSQDTKTVSNQQTSATFNNGIGNVRWVGGLSTGVDKPNSALYVPHFTENTNVWKLSKETGTKYDKYLSDYNEVKAYLDQQCPQLFADTNLIKQNIYSFNSYASRPFQQEDISFSEGFTWTSSTKYDGKLDYKLPVFTMNPELVFTIKADWLGIEIAKGQPRINSASSVEFNSGDLQGMSSVSVTNVGDGAGSFDFSLEDCSRFSQSYPVTGQQFASKQTKTVNVPIKSTGSADERTETCKIKVCDASGFGTCVESDVVIHQLPALLCTPGRQLVEGNCIKECIGNEYVNVKCCESGERVTTNIVGQYICEDIVSGEVQQDSFLDKLFAGFVAAFIVVTVILVLLAILAFIIPIPGFRLFMIEKVIKNFKVLALVYIAGIIVLTLLFSVPTANLAATIVASLTG